MKNWRRRLSFCLILVLILGISPSQSWALANQESLRVENAQNGEGDEALAITPDQGELTLLNKPEYDEAVDDQIVVLYKDGSEKVATLGLEIDDFKKGESLSDRVDVIELKDPQAIDETIAELAKHPNVLAVERNAILQTAVLPNDPYIENGSAWFLEKIGGAQTWDQGGDLGQVVVAVIDTGLNTNHPDLANRVLGGYDFVNGSEMMMDLSGHGTMVSGCVAAVANNGIGISGVGGLANIKIRPYRTGGMYPNDRNLYISHIAAAIMKAADQEDVRVINMSFGTYSTYDSIRKSIEYAASRGKVLVSSAGNEGATARAGEYGYPASYDEVISVAATDRNDNRPNYSQYNDQVDLSAPGDSIISTNRSGGYGPGSGTSFSAPMVSGACAFLLALKNDLTAQEVQEILEKTALDLGSPGKDRYHGYGRIQLDKAFAFITATRPLTGIRFDFDQISVLKGQTTTLKINYQPEDTTDDRTVIWSSSDPAIAQIDENGKISAKMIGRATITAKVGAFEANCLINVKENGKLIRPKTKTHVENYGWQEWRSDPEISGTTGESLRLEGICIELEALEVGVRYRTHIQNQGWESAWRYDRALSGTTGESLRLEGIQIELTGIDRELWDIYYQVHAQNLGWLDWAKSGEAAGTEGLSLRLEAIRVKAVPKGDPPPGPTEKPFVKSTI